MRLPETVISSIIVLYIYYIDVQGNHVNAFFHSTPRNPQNADHISSKLITDHPCTGWANFSKNPKNLRGLIIGRPSLQCFLSVPPVFYSVPPVFWQIGADCERPHLEPHPSGSSGPGDISTNQCEPPRSAIAQNCLQLAELQVAVEAPHPAPCLCHRAKLCKNREQLCTSVLGCTCVQCLCSFTPPYTNCEHNFCTHSWTNVYICFIRLYTMSRARCCIPLSSAYFLVAPPISAPLHEARANVSALS